MITCYIQSKFNNELFQEIPSDVTSFLRVCLTIDAAKRYIQCNYQKQFKFPFGKNKKLRKYVIAGLHKSTLLNCYIWICATELLVSTIYSK